MNLKDYFLKNKEGLYYSLFDGLKATTSERSKATIFDTDREAFDWLEKHSIHNVKLEKLGFKVYSREIGKEN